MKNELIEKMMKSNDPEMQNLAMTLFYEKNRDFVMFSPYHGGTDYTHEVKLYIFRHHFQIYKNRWRGYKKKHDRNKQDLESAY